MNKKYNSLCHAIAYSIERVTVAKAKTMKRTACMICYK